MAGYSEVELGLLTVHNLQNYVMHLSIETPILPPTPGKYEALMGVTKGFGTFFCVQGGGGFVIFCCISFAHGVGD